MLSDCGILKLGLFILTDMNIIPVSGNYKAVYISNNKLLLAAYGQATFLL